MSAILFSKAIGPVPISVVLKESHQSTIGITEQPIETGAKITDHAYIEPKKLTLEFADLNATATYNELVRFQTSRVPFTIVSGLYVYTNMLIQSITAEREFKTSRILSGKADLREIIIVSTAYTGDDSSSKSDGKQGGKKSTRAATPTKQIAGDKTTGDKVGGTTMRGDAAEKSVNQSAIKQIGKYL